MSNGAGAGERQDESSASAASLTTSAPDRFIPVAIFILAFVTYAWFYSGGGWNQNAHFDLTRALVERGTLHIDGYAGNTADVSEVRHADGTHVYINKPPGASFLAAIPYAVLYLIERPLGVSPGAWEVATLNAYLVTVMTCGLTGALIPVVLYAWACRRASRGRALALALGVAFGTGIFPYSTLLFAHVPAALFLLVAFAWLDERPIAAGAAAGIAGTCYYLGILAAGVLFAGALVRNRRTAWKFLIAGLPFGILLAVYHWICFGSPFRTAVEVSEQFTDAGLIFGVFGKPSLIAIWALVFSEYRGLLLASPVVLLAIVGAIAMIRRRMLTRELVMIGVIFAMLVVILSGFNGWHGGAAFGPRYLLPVVPLVCVPLLFFPRRAAALAIGVGVLSATMQLLVTAVDPMPIPTLGRPFRGYILPTYVTGEFPPYLAAMKRSPELRVGSTSINRHSIDEIQPHQIYPPGSQESQWASFNLGELMFGPGSRASIVPIALWMLAGSALLWRRVAAP